MELRKFFTATILLTTISISGISQAAIINIDSIFNGTVVSSISLPTDVWFSLSASSPAILIDQNSISLDYAPLNRTADVPAGITMVFSGFTGIVRVSLDLSSTYACGFGWSSTSVTMDCGATTFFPTSFTKLNLTSVPIPAALWLFGSRIENAWGSKAFVIYYFVCVIGAGLVQLFFASQGVSDGDVYPTIGASGGVFGILLAFALTFPNERLMLIFPPVVMRAKWFVLIYACVELYAGVTGTLAGIAHFAHLGGMLFGFLLLWYWGKHPLKP